MSSPRIRHTQHPSPRPPARPAPTRRAPVKGTGRQPAGDALPVLLHALALALALALVPTRALADGPSNAGEGILAATEQEEGQAEVTDEEASPTEGETQPGQAEGQADRTSPEPDAPQPAEEPAAGTATQKDPASETPGEGQVTSDASTTPEVTQDDSDPTEDEEAALQDGASPLAPPSLASAARAVAGDPVACGLGAAALVAAAAGAMRLRGGGGELGGAEPSSYHRRYHYLL